MSSVFIDGISVAGTQLLSTTDHLTRRCYLWLPGVSQTPQWLKGTLQIAILNGLEPGSPLIVQSLPLTGQGVAALDLRITQNSSPSFGWAFQVLWEESGLPWKFFCDNVGPIPN